MRSLQLNGVSITAERMETSGDLLTLRGRSVPGRERLGLKGESLRARSYFSMLQAFALYVRGGADAELVIGVPETVRPFLLSYSRRMRISDRVVLAREAFTAEEAELDELFEVPVVSGAALLLPKSHRLVDNRTLALLNYLRTREEQA